MGVLAKYLTAHLQISWSSLVDDSRVTRGLRPSWFTRDRCNCIERIAVDGRKAAVKLFYDKNLETILVMRLRIRTIFIVTRVTVLDRKY